MSTTTPNLGLFKYDTTTDSNIPFSIDDALNANWDILDENIGSRNIGEIVASTLPLTDAGLHLLDGALIDGNGIYSAFVDYIANLYGDGTDIPSYFTDETSWQTAVTTYGVCGKFVYDSTNNTVRLPKVTGIIEGTTDVNALGDLVQAGLPNITGTAQTAPGRSGYTMTGAMGQYATPNATDVYTPNSASPTATQYGISFDASSSSAIYGNSSTVQPQTIKCYYYIVIATSTKTDIQVDIDNVVSDLNGKADRDLSNVTDISIPLYLKSGTNCYMMARDTSKPSVIFRNDGTDFHMLLTNANDPKGTWNAIRPFAFNLSSGKVLSNCQNSVVVERYVNGTSWYRVWSDGWIEQGGNISDSTITFLKPFSNTNYTITTNNRNNSTSGNTATYNDLSIYSNASYNKTTTSVFIRGAGTWYACGY